MNSFIKTLENVTILSGNRTATVKTSVAETSGVLDALRAGDYEKALLLADKAEAIRRRSGNGFQVEGGVVYRNGVAIHNAITQRILEFVEDGLPINPLFKFLENLEANPSKRAVDELYSFLEHQNLPITEDGHFIAYKSVRSDFFSKASGNLTLLKGRQENGRIFNGIGEEIEAVRNEIDDDKDRTCSKGLHVGALAYSGPNGWYHNSDDKVVIVKVNPRDAVSVPSDHQAQKLRVCAYTVIAEFEGAFEQPLVDATGNLFEGSDDFDEVECVDNGDYDSGCGWSGSYMDLDEYGCPNCGLDEFIFRIEE